MSKTRFDLENDICAISTIEDDLETFLGIFLDSPHKMTEDELWNYISGIRHVLKLRRERLWDTFLQVFELDQYHKGADDGTEF